MSMLKVEADRDLLFGALALQMDFVTRDGLSDALDDWAGDRTVSLCQVLVRRGVLAADEAKLLLDVAGRHLARHGQDPERSLRGIQDSGISPDGLVSIDPGTAPL